MKEGAPCSYLANPDSYCEHISTLIQNGTDEWQNLWQLAIKELFHNSEIFQNPVNNINAINSLLKVIEKAFKERVYRLRVQAFDCWRYFIVTIDTCDVSDKLLNVLLIPLCASNHSVFEVLRAKLQTWATLLNSNLILRSTILKKGVPNLLKILYGPHALRQASEFDDLVEVCGNIYLKMLEKCTAYETVDLLLGSLERAIPVLTKNESTQHIATLIWTNVLDHISKNNWPASQFNNLIKTFQNLVSSNCAGSNALIDSFLTVLVEIYPSFPVGYLKLNLALFIRCLFHVSKNNISNLMEHLMKKCQNENLFFNEIVKTWHACVEEYKNELYKYWFAAKTCFLAWEKHEEASHSTWVLLLPVEYLHSKWDAALLEQLRSGYDEVLPSNNADAFIKSLCDDVTEFISESENLPVSLLNAIIDLCKIVLQSPKQSDGIRHVESVLLAIFRKIPSHDTLLSSTYKPFAPRFIATVLFFLKEFPESLSELAPITRACSSFINSDEKDSAELSVVHMIQKYCSDEEGNNETVLKPHNGVNSTPNAKTTNHMKTSFLSRLSSSIEKKKKNSEVTSKLPSTPKSVKRTEEDDVQFITIKPRPKNSPMTEHQKEIAKSRSYIPALYEDLSQSQSQSQTESISLLSNKSPTPVISGVQYFEEDANLPPDRSDARDEVENTPAVITVSKNYPGNANVEKELPTSKKSLFKDKTNSETPKPIYSDGNKNLHVEVESAELQNNVLKNENSSSKRRNTRSSNTMESVPPKRVKRVSENISEQKNHSSEQKETSEEKKKRGRRKKIDSDDTEVQEMSVVDSESQNLFVSTPIRLEKSTAVSSPLNSLMNVKNSEDSAKTRRKSLKSKSSELPTRSPIATRKRKSSLITSVVLKKVSTSKPADEQSNNNSSAVVPKSESNVALVACVSGVENSTETTTKVGIDEEKDCRNSIDVENELSSEMNNSVVIIESTSVGEIISIPDSESPEKTTETNNVNSIKTHLLDVSDESTFFEDAELLKKQVNNVGQIKKIDERRNEETAKVSETIKLKKNSLNESFPEKLVLEETEAENARRSVQKTEQTINNVAKVLNLNVINKSSENESDKLPSKTSSGPPKNKFPSNKTTSPEKSEGISKKETPSPKKSSGKTGSTSELPDISTVKKKLIDEIDDKGESQSASSDQSRINTSPITNNTRTFKIMKMACDSHNISKPKHFVKLSKSPLSSSTGLSNSKTMSTNQRTMKILMANNGSLEKPRLSPNKIIPTSTERLKYYPKECTSPGILKKPDLNGSVSSPKSAKFVNFAEQLTATRTFDVNEENYYDSYNSDEISSNNLINDDEATSQEVLYSPLLNCSDDVKNIIDRLSLSNAAVDLFHRMGIRTVGHLASISTLTAKSIPAGDNRLHRLRKTLKDYDDWRTSFYESKGLRIPSARRRILCKSPESILEISSLIELLDEAESIESSTKIGEAEVENNSNNTNNNTSNSNNNLSNSHVNVSNNNRMPTVVIAKLSEENCPSLLNKNEIIVRLEEQSSPTKASKPTDVSRSPTKADLIPDTMVKDAVVMHPENPTTDEVAAEVFSDSLSSSNELPPPSDLVEFVDQQSQPARISENITSLLTEQEVFVDPAANDDVTKENVINNVSVVETSPKQLIDLIECNNGVPDESSIQQNQHEISEDTDLIYTANDEQPCPKRVLSKTHSKRVATCEYIASLRGPLVDDHEPTEPPSPEIVTVEIEDDDNGAEAEKPQQDREGISENIVEKESSVSIFSPDVTSRTVNRQTEIQSQCASQSVIEASKNQLEECSLFAHDETSALAAGGNLVESDGTRSALGDVQPAVTQSHCQGEGVFCQLLSTLWEPFLTDRLKTLLLSDEQSAFVEYSEIMRKHVTRLRELREAGIIGADKLEECGLTDFINEISLLKK